MENQNNPCESCIHQSKSWNEEPCYRCGSENDYAWCEDEHGTFPNVVKGTPSCTRGWCDFTNISHRFKENKNE